MEKEGIYPIDKVLHRPIECFFFPLRESRLFLPGFNAEEAGDPRRRGREGWLGFSRLMCSAVRRGRKAANTGTRLQTLFCLQGPHGQKCIMQP